MREDGWYWVRNKAEYGGKWIVAQWGPHPMAALGSDQEPAWWESANELCSDDTTYAEIGERVTRDDPMGQLSVDVEKLAGIMLDEVVAKIKSDFDESIQRAERMIRDGK